MLLPNSFESLPAEIRNQIYGYLLSFQYTEVESPFKTFKFHLAILQTNKAINIEATSFFCSTNPFVTLRLPMDFRSSRLTAGFPTVRHPNIKRFPHAALHCQFVRTREFHVPWSVDDYGELSHSSRSEFKILIVAYDLARCIEKAMNIRRSKRPSCRLVMGLCINEAFQNRMTNGSRTMILAFNYFLDLLRSQKVAIGPASDACAFKPTNDSTLDHSEPCGFGPHLYFWGKELIQICRDSGFEANQLELDIRDEKVECIDEEPSSSVRSP